MRKYLQNEEHSVPMKKVHRPWKSRLPWKGVHFSFRFQQFFVLDYRLYFNIYRA